MWCYCSCCLGQQKCPFMLLDELWFTANSSPERSLLSPCSKESLHFVSYSHFQHGNWRSRSILSPKEAVECTIVLFQGGSLLSLEIVEIYVITAVRWYMNLMLWPTHFISGGNCYHWIHFQLKIICFLETCMWILSMFLPDSSYFLTSDMWNYCISLLTQRQCLVYLNFAEWVILCSLHQRIHATGCSWPNKKLSTPNTTPEHPCLGIFQDFSAEAHILKPFQVWGINPKWILASSCHEKHSKTFMSSVHGAQREAISALYTALFTGLFLR